MRGHFGEEVKFELRKADGGYRLLNGMRFRSPHLHAWLVIPASKVFAVRPGKYAKAKILREWLYSQGAVVTKYGLEEISKNDADIVYVEALAADGACRPRQLLSWFLLEFCGHLKWEQCRQAEEDLVR